MLRLGGTPPPLLDPTWTLAELEERSRGLYFCIAPLLNYYPQTRWLAGWRLSQIDWECPAHSLALLAEYVALGGNMRTWQSLSVTALRKYFLAQRPRLLKCRRIQSQYLALPGQKRPAFSVAMLPVSVSAAMGQPPMPPMAPSKRRQPAS